MLGRRRNFPSKVEFLEWKNAVITNGGAVSTERETLLSTLISSLKACGSWYQIDDVWLLAAENPTQSLVSLKQKRLCTAVNSPTFIVDRGYTFDGLTNYIDTSFVCSEHATIMSAVNSRIAGYEIQNVNANGYPWGGGSTLSRLLRVRTRISTNAYLDNMTNSSTFTLPSPDSRGYTVGSRIGDSVATHMAFKNGVSMVRTVDASSVGVSLPIHSIFIGSTNFNGAYAQGKATTVSLVLVGAALSAEQELYEYNAIQSFMTSIGAQV